VLEVAERVAIERGLTCDEVGELTIANTRAAFGLPLD
jgi:hypothetical protein